MQFLQGVRVYIELKIQRIVPSAYFELLNLFQVCQIHYELNGKYPNRSRLYGMDFMYWGQIWVSVTNL